NEIGRRRNAFQIHLAKFAHEKVQPLRIVLARPSDVFVIVKRRERAGLDERINVEWLTNFFERGDEFRVADAVTEAQASQPVDLRKGAHQNEVQFEAQSHQRQQVDRIVEKIDVG